MYEEYASHDKAAYGGYIKNDRELLECSSGGIATALAKHMIKENGYVAGVAYSEDFYSVKYEIAETEDQLERFKGSKYVEVEKGNIFNDVQEILKRGDKLLFFGLPCTVAALKSFLREDYDNLITCELVCHGPTKAKVHEEYIKHLEDKYKSKVVEFSVRKKEKNRLPIFLYAKFQNGRVFKREFYSTEYGFAFGVMGRASCYRCKFKGNNRTGDIMLGDFWGACSTDAYWNKKGVSIIFAETEKGNAFLKETEDISLYDITLEKAVSSCGMLINTRRTRPEKENFEKMFAEKGLFYAAHHAKKPTVRYIPSSLKSLAKRAYYIIKP